MSTESIIGTIHNVGGHTCEVTYDLIFTSERVIAVNIKHPEDVPPYQNINLNYLFFGSWWSKHSEQSERLRLSEEKRQAITRLTPDELLKLSAHNFEIKYNDIKSIVIDRGLIETKLKFVIGNTGQRYRQRDFTIKRQLIPEAKQILDKVLKSKFMNDQAVE